MSKHYGEIEILSAIFSDPVEQDKLIQLVRNWVEKAASSVDRQKMDAQGGNAAFSTSAVVKDVFSVLLGRGAENSAIEHYTQMIPADGGIRPVLLDVLHSEEFRRKIPFVMPELPHPKSSIDSPVSVFIHIQNTAGAPVEGMIVDAFRDKKILVEQSDTLYLRSPAEVAGYDFLLGNYNYDSLKFIPKNRINLLTHLREPNERVISLYRFWRAHAENHPSFHERMGAAKRHELNEFTEDVLKNPHHDTWNHMTWAILGESAWDTWKQRLAAVGPAGKSRNKLLLEFRQAIRDRLQQFKFIGMQNDFERSAKTLQKILENDELSIEHHRSSSNPGETTSISQVGDDDQLPVNEVSAVGKLTELDQILYAEANLIYQERTQNAAA